MIKFLLQRPIAVLMAFTACFIIGWMTYSTLPVSLLPDIAIPEITVQVSADKTSARELENTVMKPLRQQLVQVFALEDIASEAYDGTGIIRLRFEYGVNTDLAFIEVNEKIDAAMGRLPKDLERPKVIKASATDIPVFYLNLTLKSDSAYGATNREAFIEMCNFAESVVKRRIEQLQEVAMVDVTGMINSQLRITPDPEKMAIWGFSIGDVETALKSNNVEPGSMKVRDGYYEYNIRFSTFLRTPEDVEDIYIRKGDRIVQLKDFCEVEIVPIEEKGISVSNGKRAITMAIIKQPDEDMERMKNALNRTVSQIGRMFPDIDFSVSRNQTELLDYSISNLQQNLSLGFALICIVAFLFLGDVKSPLVIGVSMVVSLVVSFVFFYLFGMSLNIISLSGLILALGMMIDSSIIVTENISQYRERGYSLRRACAAGTTEVITPMLSSSLTTIAVFFPLIFMSGIAGAVFFDQAFSVTVGLMVSYFTGIILLPVLYMLIYRAEIHTRRWRWLSVRIPNPIKEHTLDRFYDKGVDWVFGHKTLSVLFCLLSLPVCVFFFYFIDKERMPDIDENELIVRIDWNENIHIYENERRINELFGQMKKRTIEQTATAGQQDFILNKERELSATEAELYFKTSEPSDIEPLQRSVYGWLHERYPKAVVSFSPPETVFEKLFVTGEPDVVAELYTKDKSRLPEAEKLRDLERRLTAATGVPPTGIAFENQLNLTIDREKLLLYKVSYDELYRVLKTAFKENQVTMLRSSRQYLPMTIAEEERTVDEVLRNTLIRTQADKQKQTYDVPLREFIRITPSEDLKSITAGSYEEYVPYKFYEVNRPEQLMRKVKEEVGDEWDIRFSGSYFANTRMLNELVVILFVSLLLMYFILASQFESFVQPLLVLAEVPIDVAFALILLWLCGHTLNLMSGIGLIVTCGIIINDSILKLDAINELRKSGMPLLDAIHEAGRRRLRPIIMTSLTTVLAMVPLLFSFDMGSELQKPLSLAMIGTMLIGTPVSLFIIPLFYWLIYRKRGVVEKKI